MTMPPDLSDLVLADVEITLAGRRLLSLSARVKPGQVLTVMGPSGSGKSTLLAYIGGFLDHAFTARGEVSIAGLNLAALAPEARRAGLLFQDALLFPHMSAGENVAFGIPSGLAGRKARRELAAKALEEVELPGFAKRDPDTLSGGQKSRVALARVLVSRPRLLLLDEPFARLDVPLRSQMRDLVFAKARQAGLPVILVTHDPEDAAAAGGDVHRLEPLSGLKGS